VLPGWKAESAEGRKGQKLTVDRAGVVDTTHSALQDADLLVEITIPHRHIVNKSSNKQTYNVNHAEIKQRSLF
jgi:hypothetical protein